MRREAVEGLPDDLSQQVQSGVQEWEKDDGDTIAGVLH
jgi:hypothetical protein